MPAVSIIMPAYNAARYIKAAVDSMLAQTFTNFELIIINDGSTDGTATILDGYTDPRIHVLNNEANIGITDTLNRGLTAATGTFIARMDADDISYRARLEKQVAYLHAHPDVGLLAANVIFIDEDGQPIKEAPTAYPGPLSEMVLRWQLLWHNPLIHSSIVLRRAILGTQQFDPTFIACEDYELWTRLLQQTRAVLLPDVLLDYRLVSTGINRTKQAIQAEHVQRIIKRELTAVLGKLPANGLDTLASICTKQQPKQVDNSAFAQAGQILFTAARQVMDQTTEPADQQYILADTRQRWSAIYEMTKQVQSTELAALNWQRRRFELTVDPAGTVRRTLQHQLKRVLGRR